jgi:hypothetical protein
MGHSCHLVWLAHVRKGSKTDFLGMTAFGAKQPFVGIDKGRGPARVVVRSDRRFVRLENARSRVSQEIIRIVVRGGNRQQIILHYAPSVCTLQSLSTPPIPRSDG